VSFLYEDRTPLEKEALEKARRHFFAQCMQITKPSIIAATIFYYHLDIYKQPRKLQ